MAQSSARLTPDKFSYQKQILFAKTEISPLYDIGIIILNFAGADGLKGKNLHQANDLVRFAVIELIIIDPTLTSNYEMTINQHKFVTPELRMPKV